MHLVKPKTSNNFMSVYPGKCCHFPENSNIATIVRFESETLGTTRPVPCPADVGQAGILGGTT